MIDGEAQPILVAAGGGGLAHGPFFDDGRQHGNGQNASLPNITAPSIGKYPAGNKLLASMKVKLCYQLLYFDSPTKSSEAEHSKLQKKSFFCTFRHYF